MRIALITAGLLCASACGAGPTPTADPPPPPSFSAVCKDTPTPFTVETPEGFTLSAPQRGPDFDTYALSKGSTPYVGVYIGNFSQFRVQGGSGVVRDDPAGHRKMRVVTEDGRERIAEYLILTGCPSFPAQVHVWAFPVPGDQATADRLAGTVRLK